MSGHDVTMNLGASVIRANAVTSKITDHDELKNANDRRNNESLLFDCLSLLPTPLAVDTKTRACVSLLVLDEWQF